MPNFSGLDSWPGAHIFVELMKADNQRLQSFSRGILLNASPFGLLELVCLSMLSCAGLRDR